MNLTQFEWIKTELKQRFYELNKINGKTVNSENVFYFKPQDFTFPKGEIVLPVYA